MLLRVAESVQPSRELTLFGAGSCFSRRKESPPLWEPPRLITMQASRFIWSGGDCSSSFSSSPLYERTSSSSLSSLSSTSRASLVSPAKLDQSLTLHYHSFWLLVTLYLDIAQAKTAHLNTLMKAAGAMGFLTCICGWYLLVVLIFGSTGIPLALPVGDLSNFMSGRRKERDE